MYPSHMDGGKKVERDLFNFLSTISDYLWKKDYEMI